ncbi:ATP synthase F0 subunit C [Desmospora activa]|uniref:Lipid-binding protein n=1 Tax=Desmospora activa DSM 45169 TaxID=1121389 RepID=A0A2T4Z4F9_9BACL|nr:ATP synthase F0 subunit C [Desmospora activa]PTM56755.1 ATP synthase F0 subcomplex C subunit [Desmospora activa DSM 45169]
MELLGICLMFGFAALAGGLGNSFVVSRFLDGYVRQPEAGGLLGRMLLGIALVEAVPIIAVGIGLYLLVTQGYF